MLLARHPNRQSVVDGWRALLSHTSVTAAEGVGALIHTDTMFDVSLVSGDLFAIAQDQLGRRRLGMTIVVIDSRDEDKRVAALEAGAADCVDPTMPLRELQARVRGLLSRRNGIAPGRRRSEGGEGNWYVHLHGRHLVSPSGARVNIAPSAFEILATLAERPQRALTRDFLIAHLPSSKRIGPRNIDVLISRLRRAFLLHDPAGITFISTTRNEGYRLTRPVARDACGITILGHNSA